MSGDSPASPRESDSPQPPQRARATQGRGLSELYASIASGVASGLLVGAAFFLGQIYVDDQRADREHVREDAQIERQNSIETERADQATMLENLRFVRALSSDEQIDRPLRSLDLHGLELSGLSLAGADFRNADLHDASFRESDLAGAAFGGADVSGTDFTGASLAGATFLYEGDETAESGSAPLSLGQADLTGASFRRVTTWRDLQMSGSNLSYARFEEVDFSDAFVSGSVFDGACATDAKWPSDTTPDLAAALPSCI